MCNPAMESQAMVDISILTSYGTIISRVNSYLFDYSFPSLFVLLLDYNYNYLHVVTEHVINYFINHSTTLCIKINQEM